MTETLRSEKAQREAEIRDKLPGDVVALLDAAQSDPGAPFEPAAVAMLSTLRADNAASWQRARAMLKTIDGVTVGDLDRMTAPRRGDDGDGKQGRPVEWSDPKPWPEPVDGAALLDGISCLIGRHVSLAPEHRDALALWCVMTWIHDRLEISPFLNVTSATKRCGKSLLLEILAELVHRPFPIGGRVTPAALFRLIEMYAPTMLFDEADTYLSDDPELRGVVNGSQRRATANIPRVIGDDDEPRAFSTWAPKAIAGIGGLPDTVLDRSIVVRLERRPAHVAHVGWRDRDRQGIEDVWRKLARWIGDSGARVAAGLSAVTFPAALHDRARDAWESLLAIADEAGGEWAGPSGRGLNACRHVMTTGAGDDSGAREMLLADLHAVFETAEWPDAIPSATIVQQLVAMESRPWPEWKRGKPLTVRQLAALLRPFDIHATIARQAVSRKRTSSPRSVPCSKPIFLMRGDSMRPTVPTLQNKGFRAISIRPGLKPWDGSEMTETP